LNKFFSLEKKKMSVCKKTRIEYLDGRVIIEKDWQISKKHYCGRNHGLPYQIGYSKDGTYFLIYYVNRGFFRGKMCQQIEHCIRYLRAGGEIEKYQEHLYEIHYFNGVIHYGDMKNSV
jgi:hypothetical protein